VSLSPVSAISDMIAPVVLITLATIFGNGLLTVGTSLADNVLGLTRERLGILRGPDGEILDEDSVPPIDHERLMQIREQMPLMVRRVRRLRTAVLIIWIATGLLMLRVGAIAIAVTADSECFGFTALALVMAGVAGVFLGIASVIGPAARSADAVIGGTRRSHPTA
jgi:hypothetical protein